ncbi:MAG: helix-turn-helix domain-containing protein [candidate division NC10 bacterium]|nr:helix-turn-helix domain-containing protein [candidate division NC10 bacterium]
MNDLISKLMELGFSEYEARIYLVLLRQNPVSGYEISKASGVPTSKIYESLQRLKNKGFIFGTEDKPEQAKKYIPIEPQELCGLLSRKIKRNLDQVASALANHEPPRESSYIWAISGRDAVLAKAENLIQQAKKTILLSAWDEDLEPLLESLEAAARRKVRIAIVSFGSQRPKFAMVFPHPIKDTIYNEKGGRGLTICVDSHTVLESIVGPEDQGQGAWSRNPGFVTVAEDYLKHDIYVMKVIGRFDELLRKTYGERYEKWRDIFSDEVV